MKYISNYRIKIIFICSVFTSIGAYSSDSNNSDPQLNLDYSGPIIIHNSQLKYSATERLTFFTQEYLEHNIPQLLPLRSAIDTWAAMYAIHPRVLSEVLKNYFQYNIIEDSYYNKNIVLQLAAGLSNGFIHNKDNNLAASIAVTAIAKSFHFDINIDPIFSNQKVPNENDYFRGNSGPPLYSYFEPPWPRGESWTGGGVHTYTGSGKEPRNSLDFFKNFTGWGGNTNDVKISAAAAGIARVYSSCSVGIVHPNGWVSLYYHLDNVQVTDLETVDANQFISNYANNLTQATCDGGHSTGPHVHFSLYYNNDPIEIDETTVDFSSWKHQAGIGNYDNNCSSSYYTLIPNNQNVCPFSLQLPNNNTSTQLIFANGFE